MMNPDFTWILEFHHCEDHNERRISFT
jgi:hypothetical protein